MSASDQPIVHTPGPWVCDGDEVLAGDYDKHIATAWNNDKVQPCESEANARLIAAAPDLLEALIYMRRTMYSNESEESIKADAAIAKALGTVV